MPDWPVVPLWGFLVVVAFARGGATYAVARGLRDVAARRTGLLERPSVRRAEDTVRRFGAPAVTLCFLTVGVQTAVNAAAGSLRMPLVRYLPALALGAVVWATVYLTVGLAVVAAFWSGHLTWLLVLLVVLVAVVTAWVLVRRALDRRGGPGSIA